MANQTAEGLNCLNTTYYGNVHLVQVHPYYSQIITRAYGKDLLTSWMDQNSSPTTRPSMSFKHLENDRLNLPLVTTGGSGGAGAAVTLTISSGYLNSGTYSQGQVGYSVFDGVSQSFLTITAKNTTTPNAHTITVSPPDNTVAINIASGQQLPILPYCFVAEGSTATSNSIRGDGVVFTNSMQQVRRDLCIQDQSLSQFTAQTTFFPLQNPLTGATEMVWYNAEIGRVETEYRNASEFFKISGKQITNTTLAALGFTGTTGVIPAIQSWGNLVPYSPATGISVTDFEDMSVTMEKNQSADEYLVYEGVVVGNDIQKALKDWFPNGAVTYGAFSGGQDQALEWGFSSLGAFNRTWHFHKMDLFNRPNYLGAPGVDYTGNFIAVPAGKTIDDGGQQVNYIQSVTLNGNGNDQGYQHYIVDGTGLFNGTIVSTTRQVTFVWIGTQGVEVTGAKQLFYGYRS